MEPSGKGDGSDGKWDNRISAERPYGPYAEGDSVNVDGYAIKAWNAAQAANNRKKYPMIDWATSWTADSVVAATAMTEVGSTETFKYDATGSSRVTQGEAVLVVVAATIDSGSRTFSRLVSRDST
jgi:hypothetical protein